MNFLKPQDYEDASLDELKDIVEPKWQNFVNDALPRMHMLLMAVNFEAGD